MDDGEAAIEAAEREGPDAVLLDLMLPKVNGFVVIERLRSQEKTRNTPILVITAVNDMEGKVRGIEAGANDYLTKPFKLFEVQTRLRVAIAAANFRRQLDVAESEIAELRGVDPLISAGTFAQLKPSLDYEMSRARRYGRPIACVAVKILDADEPAKTLGDDGVSVLARAVISTIRMCLRGADRLFRLGAEEYLALLPETDIAGARRAAHRIVNALHDAFRGGPTHLAVTAGVAVYPAAAITSGEELLLAASAGLDAAQLRGPGTVGEV